MFNHSISDLFSAYFTITEEMVPVEKVGPIIKEVLGDELTVDEVNGPKLVDRFKSELGLTDSQAWAYLLKLTGEILPEKKPWQK